MKLYANQCQHIKKDGSRCETTTKGDVCYAHRKDKKGNKKQCEREGCDEMTTSKFNLCAKHRQHAVYKDFRLKHNLPTAKE